MNTRSRARNGNAGLGDLEGGGENRGQANPQPEIPPTREARNMQASVQEGQGHGDLGAPPPPQLIQITPEALRQLVEDASAQAANKAVAQYVSENAPPPRPPRHPRQGRDAPLAPENREQRPRGVQGEAPSEEEVNSRAAQPKDDYFSHPPQEGDPYEEDYFPPPPPRGDYFGANFIPPPHQGEAYSRERGMGGQAPPSRFPSPRSRGVPAHPLAVAPPRRSPFAPHVLAEAIQPGIRIPSLNEYSGVGDPQDHLDRFLARADLLDVSDAAYCKLFRTTLSGKAMTWFNQLPPGSIENFEQLSQRFLHHFAINKRYPKTASYLFTVVQKKNEGLREYVRRFSEAVLEVPHVNPELLASIMQQNLRRSRFKESIAGKPPADLDELLVRAEKHIRIEETAGSTPLTPLKRRANEYGGGRPSRADGERGERRHLQPSNPTRYTPLNAPRAEILAVAKQQGIVRWPFPMKDNPKRLKSDKYCHFHRDRGHSTEDCHHLKIKIEKLIQRGYLKEFVDRRKPPAEEPAPDTGRPAPPMNPGGSSRSDQPRKDNLPTAGVIGVISGGPAGGDSIRARKAATERPTTRWATQWVMKS